MVRIVETISRSGRETGCLARGFVQRFLRGGMRPLRAKESGLGASGQFAASLFPRSFSPRQLTSSVRPNGSNFEFPREDCFRPLSNSIERTRRASGRPMEKPPIGKRRPRRGQPAEDVMPDFNYVAFDDRGQETRGMLQVSTLNEACQRLREMGFFPTKVVQKRNKLRAVPALAGRKTAGMRAGALQLQIPGLGSRIKPRTLTAFTRQTATLVEAGMPLIRGLKLLAAQEASAVFKRVIEELIVSIESGASFSEALAQHPKIFNPLYISMVRAGEAAGALEVVLRRLAEFMEKAARIKNKVLAALYYPAAVMTIAGVIVSLLMIFVVPKFRDTFQGLLNGRPLPPFTQFFLAISDVMKHQFPVLLTAVAVVLVVLKLLKKTTRGRAAFDRLKLSVPLLGPVVRKTAIARFTRTLGTLMGSGVPVLQALAIVKETAGNDVIRKAVLSVHEAVKEGESMTTPLKACDVFPAVVIGMVDVGEQTGALPDMLLKIADNYDEEVDSAVAGMTSLLEPILLVLLAVVVGSIVIAMFLPIIAAITGVDDAPHAPGE
jgi:type IV pilus assembly protein PilC